MHYSLECPTVILCDAIFKRNLCTGYAAYRLIETVTNTTVDIAQVELLEAII